MPIPQLKPRRSVSWRESHSPSKKPPSSNYSQKKAKKQLKMRLMKTALYLAAFSALAIIIIILWLSRDLPNPNQLMEREVAQSTKIYDRTGENIIYEISGEQRRTLIKLEDLPDYVKNATIAIEDKNFYKHSGFSIWAMFRTAVTNVIYRRSAGGSTLTQQFIKNAVLTNEKKISRKLKEIILAYRLEQKFSKDEILQMYLNEIPYGSNAYGIEAASQKYFGKSSRELTIAEAATLAALPQSPSRYSPYGPNKDVLLGRKNYILDIMVEQGHISEEERDFAKQEEIVFKGRDNNMTAPHFVMYIKSILSERYGEKTVEQGGLKIYTTLDLYKQKIAEEVIKEKTKDYPSKFNANNAALISIDPKTGEVLAMIGSRDYFDDSIDGQVNVTIRPRQPGSSIKPLVYAALFEKGYTPNTLLYDVITNFSTNSAEPYIPKNYDGSEHGPVTIKKALAGSLNIPAVKAIYLAGINTVIDLAESMGYTTFSQRNRFGLALVLGGGEVKMIEHVNAYSAFARDGKISPITSILKVEDKDGRIIEEVKSTEKKVLDSQTARMINNILSDNEARSFIFGSRSYLTLGNRPAAAKTGTTNGFHDAWTVGYTPSLITGVWIGNSNNKPMSGKADGSVLAAPIWQEFMSKVLGDTPIEAFKEPDDYKTGKSILDGKLEYYKVLINKETGNPIIDWLPEEAAQEKLIPKHHSILFYVNKDDPKGDAPINPDTDPQFNIWENAIKNWAIKNASSSHWLIPSLSDNHQNESAPEFKIISPNENEIVNSNLIEIKLDINNDKIIKIDYFLNNILWQSKAESVNLLTTYLPPIKNGYHILKVKVCDNQGLCSEQSVNFNLLIKDNDIKNQNVSTTINFPHSGIALNKQDFPINLDITINNPTQTSQLKLIQENNKNSKPVLIINSNSLNNNNQITWPYPGNPGTYNLFIETYNWSGEKTKSNSIITVIN